MAGNHAKTKPCKNQTVSLCIVAAVIINHMGIDRNDRVPVHMIIHKKIGRDSQNL